MINTNKALHTVVIVAALIFSSCGVNQGEKNESITPEQSAEKLMNEGEYEKAIEILEPLYEANPTEYDRIPLLAAAYASLIGVDILSILKNATDSSGSASSNAFQQVEEFTPDDDDGTKILILEKAINALKSIPEEMLGPDGDEKWGVSAEIQLVLNKSIYATMVLKSIVAIDINGDFDASDLENLSVEDAARILAALGDAATSVGGEQAAQIAARSNSTLEGIANAEGADDAERMRNYLGSR